MGTAAQTTRYVVRLKSREEIAERTLALRFEKPAGFTFKPGQYVSLTLPNPTETDAEGNTREFSIASAPQEDTLMIATRIRDTAFKRVLAGLPLQSEAGLEGPFGNFTLHNNAVRTAVLLAGGIGITPFRSMVFRAAGERLRHRIFLFFSNHRPEDAPFLDELQSLQTANPNYRFIGVMTKMEESRRLWEGERGRISKEMLTRHLEGATTPVYYVAGPPHLVAGMQALLSELDVDDDDIRAEEFAGY